MEIVYTTKFNKLFKEELINGVYGDILDIEDINVHGISYDDEWKVKKFLSPHRILINNRVKSILNYLNLEANILNKKIKYLSKTDLKFILLAKCLLMNKKYLIFDYFDVGLTYKDQKRFINILRNLKKDNFKIIVISNDLVFLDKIVDNILVINNKKILFNGKMNELLESNMIDDEEIIKFINLARKKGAKLDYTLNSNELLKDIYRSVA